MYGIMLLVSLYTYIFGQLMSNTFGFDTSTALRSQAVVFLVCALLMYLFPKDKKYDESFLPSKANNFIIFYFILLALFTFTSFKYGTYSRMMTSYMLNVGTVVLYSILFAIVTSRKGILAKCYRWTPIFCYVLTIVLFAMFARNTGKSILEIEVGGQTLSYAAAFSASLLLFYISWSNDSDDPTLFAGKSWNVVKYLAVLGNSYIVIAGAGRGATIVLIVMLAHHIYLNFTSKQGIKVIGSIALIFVALAAIWYFSQAEAIQQGFGAISRFFSEGISTDRSSLERIDLYSKAAKVIENNHYILGGGAGATAYELGFYSHNIFIDLLVDYGYIFGGIIGIYILSVFYKLLALSRININAAFLFSVYAPSLMMLMFSGSIYETPAIWFVVVYFSTSGLNKLRRNREGAHPWKK